MKLNSTTRSVLLAMLIFFLVVCLNFFLVDFITRKMSSKKPQRTAEEVWNGEDTSELQ